MSPRSLKNHTLLLASILFYGWGAPVVLPFLLVSCVIDFFVGAWLVPNKLSQSKRQNLLTGAVVLNLSALFYYKYFSFAVSQLGQLCTSIGIPSPTIPTILLPIGISFFTFHKISYLGDIYRGKVSPAKSLADYCLYILFFPQLIAGPIIRYSDVSTQFRNRTHSVDNVFCGLTRLCIGLGKKVLIADTLGAVTDQIFSTNAAHLAAFPVWLAAICYSFQIYFDFSGYSDMAIGLARVFGFTFKENFNRPYAAVNFTDFWRRWHISLSTFMREYLYIPLGGNRGSKFRTYLNLWITFLLSGLWHGASWNFVFWGAFHGGFLTLDKLGWESFSSRLPKVTTMVWTFLLVTIGWVFFRATSLGESFKLLSIMFGNGEIVPTLPRAFLIDNRQMAMLGLAALLSFMPSIGLKSVTSYASEIKGNALVVACRAVSVFLIFWMSVAALASRGYTPFLYFKF